MAAMPGRMFKWMTVVSCAVVFFAGCKDDEPAPPPPAPPPVIQSDLEGSMKGVPEDRRAAVRACLDDIEKLLREIMAGQKWDLSGRTITIRLENTGPDTGGETLPGADAGAIVMKISRAFCDWPASLRRMVLAHELDHARVMDDPVYGDGNKTRRQLRAEQDATDRALRGLPADTSSEVRLKHLQESLRAQIAQLEARIREEERAYAAADSYGPGLGVSEDDLKRNRANKDRVIEGLRQELEKLRGMLKKYGG